MKKSLLLLAGSVFGLVSFAQFNAADWEMNDATVNVTQVTGITGEKNADQWNPGGTAGQYKFTHSGTTTTVAFENMLANDGNNWGDFKINLTGWSNAASENPGGDPFGVDTLIGYSVDLSADPTVTIVAEADKDMNIRMDLLDIIGKVSNSASPKYTLVAGTEETITFNWSDDIEATVTVDHCSDLYAGDWNGVTNGRYTEGVGIAQDEDVPLVLEKIAQVSITIDDAAQGALGDKKTLTLKSITVGNGSNTVTLVKPYCVYNPTAADCQGTGVYEISQVSINYNMGVVSAEGTINVVSLASGQIVATGINSVDCNDLTPGVYAAVVNGTTKKIVVE